MNKEKFIKELGSATGLDSEKCAIVNDILEKHFIVGKKNKEKIVSSIVEQLGLTSEEANQTYEAAMSILGAGLKDKLKHPFGPQD